MEVALRSSERMTVIVNDLLNGERLAAAGVVFRRDAILLPVLVAQAIEGIRPFAERFGVQVDLSSTPASGIPAIGDEARTLQVIDNLLSNAIKFAPSGSKVQVVIEPLESELVVSVRDHGSVCRGSSRIGCSIDLRWPSRLIGAWPAVA